jgi:site-specific DNA recombinase
MDPELFKVFVQEFTAEWNRLQAESSAGLTGKRHELAKVRQQLDRLLDAIAEGTPAAAVQDRMIALESRRQSLETELATAEEPQPRLHPAVA